MLCPHCHKMIEDGLGACPHCHAALDAPVISRRAEPVFCEGCGAKLNESDRVCPKCGRPAPGILSSKSAASDLAAGRTASFPRLTSEQVSADLVKPTASAFHVLSDAADPAETNIMVAQSDDAAQESKSRRRPKKVHTDEDAYHKHKRQIPKPLIVICVLVALIGGSYWFVTEDPMGVMPEFYKRFDAAAKEAFPSRQVGEGKKSKAASDAVAASSANTGSKMSDSVLFGKIEGIYNEIVEIGDSGSFDEAASAFNGSYLLSSHADRESASSGAYELRQKIQAVLDEIGALNPSDSSAYTEDIEHLRQLATWLYERIDYICLSWDESLKVNDGENIYEKQSDILAPLRSDDGSAKTNYNSNVETWKPEQKM